MAKAKFPHTKWKWQKAKEEYDIQSAEDIEEALKDLPGGTIKEMMEAEMDHHLDYEKSERSDSDDYRNGYKSKTVKSRFGKMEIEVSQDRRSTFEPQVVKKGQKNINNIDSNDLHWCHSLLSSWQRSNP